MPVILTIPMMIPARTTPAETASDVVLMPISRKLAASVPVHAPVPGSGIPTNSSRARKEPVRPARWVSLCPPDSPFCRHQVKKPPMYFLSLPHSRTLLAKK